MSRQKIIDKIKKLLSLSESSNPNEAALAFSRAQKLMREYCIELGDLKQDDYGVLEVDTLPGLRSAQSVIRIASILKKAFGVEIILCKKVSSVSKIHIIGPKDLLETIEYVFVFLCRSYKDALKNYSLKLYKSLIDELVEYENVFRQEYPKYLFLVKDLKKEICRFHYVMQTDPTLMSAPQEKKAEFEMHKYKDLLCYAKDFDASIRSFLQRSEKNKKKSFEVGFFAGISGKVEEFNNCSQLNDIKKFIE
ncbi:MAG: DUF2786 domain-containing protein, partial [Succinivibrio sp.]